jgi:DUF971 family protein
LAGRHGGPEARAAAAAALEHASAAEAGTSSALLLEATAVAAFATLTRGAILARAAIEAEVKGHGPGQEVLQTGKREIDVLALEPVGNYAVQPMFSDGHNTGIFTWDYLYFLGSQQAQLWTSYADRLASVGADRDGPTRVASGTSCSNH